MLPDEQCGLIRVLVISAAFELGFAELIVPVLHALALSHRIDAHDNNARAGEVCGPRILACLARTMPRRNDQRRERTLAVGHIHVCSNPVVRTALIRDVLDGKSVFLDQVERLCVDGATRRRDAADQFNDATPNLTAPGDGLFFRLNGRNAIGTLGQHFVTDVVEIGMHLRGRRLRLGLRGRLHRWGRCKASTADVLGEGWAAHRRQQNCA